MADSNDLATRLAQRIEARIELEADVRTGRMSGPRAERAYEELQRGLAALFRDAPTAHDGVPVMLELIRVLENRLVDQQNITGEPGAETRALARLVTRFIDDGRREPVPVMTALESTYYRAVASLLAGDREAAREGFTAVCASEESDEVNDVKYKAYVVLGFLAQEDADFAGAKELHDRSIRHSSGRNVTAQALALKALNAFALQEREEARRLFQDALELFDPAAPHFNSYFHRNALSFSGAIHFDRGEWDAAEGFYRRVLEAVDDRSFDHFDALAHLGRIACARQRWDDAVELLERAVDVHRFSENEYVVDTWFRIARCHLRRGDAANARRYLEKVAATEVRYSRKPQALDLLGKIA